MEINNDQTLYNQNIYNIGDKKNAEDHMNHMNNMNTEEKNIEEKEKKEIENDDMDVDENDDMKVDENVKNETDNNNLNENDNTDHEDNVKNNYYNYSSDDEVSDNENKYTYVLTVDNIPIFCSNSFALLEKKSEDFIKKISIKYMDSSNVYVSNNDVGDYTVSILSKNSIWKIEETIANIKISKVGFV